MPINAHHIRRNIQSFDFTNLFIEELGWDRYRSQLEISIDDHKFALKPVAEKRGMVIWVCSPGLNGRIPEYNVRRRIERAAAKSIREHFIIYVDDTKTTQIWQWAAREKGRPDICREEHWYTGQTGERILQKLQQIAFDIEEEEDLNLIIVTGRARAAFDVEKVTKKFYDQFKTEHKRFLSEIIGISLADDQEWYASVMLNRLMFVYFIQRKGFLDSDTNYLRNRLALMQHKYGDDRFHTFYRHFLLRLFHEGLGDTERNPELDQLLGNIPYLNGGLFAPHQIEQNEGYSIDIPDEAFSRIFDFFDKYHWHLDERPLRRDDEINPDVLGFIFEKYINQKQMGAYYTKEDITEYISRNTIVPRLFDIAKRDCKIAFDQNGTVWKLPQVDPDRYIFDAVKHGCDSELLPEIAMGVNDVSRRDRWNFPASEPYSLPTEIWREVVARRQRYAEIKEKLVSGQVTSINDFITYNLDIRRLAEDVITDCEGSELLRAFWDGLNSIKILDPTVGSGAFLFAALNILEPLYEACLNRMQAFVDDGDRSVQENKPSIFGEAVPFAYFRSELKRFEDHRDKRYHIYKSIIVNNLYGVDIMEEATEICKLRLFLKLVAQVDDPKHIEPLPDIDFNIRAGNTLVGFATQEELRIAITGSDQQNLLLGDDDETLIGIEHKAALINQQFKHFQHAQSEDSAIAKGELGRRLKSAILQPLNELRSELDTYLAKRYGIDNDKAKLEWHSSHKPFHWFVEFYGVLRNGGFDVIIGNPPYVEYSKIKEQYRLFDLETLDCGNLYGFVIERCMKLNPKGAQMGMIVQLPIVCTDRMTTLQSLLRRTSAESWFATFDDRPARLFDGLEHIRATVFVVQKGFVDVCKVATTKYYRWYTDYRAELFNTISFENTSDCIPQGAIPKLGDSTAISIFRKMRGVKPLSCLIDDKGKHTVYFHNAPQYWIRAITFIPYFWNERGGEQVSTQIKPLQFNSYVDAQVACALLNSSLFYWWFVVLSDCRHLNMREINSFPVNVHTMSEETKNLLSNLCSSLMLDMKSHAFRKTCVYKTTGTVKYDEYYPRRSRAIINEIDGLFAHHLGLEAEQNDFLQNYDIKYRMGRGDAEESED
jgi:hypothetical protein